MKVSNCCESYPIGASEDMGLCPICREHCEYVEENPCEICGEDYETCKHGHEDIPLENKE